MDRVLFMPCSLSPLKEQAPSVTDDQRCRMIELAVQGLDWAMLDRTDLELPPPSWSWRVAERAPALLVSPRGGVPSPRKGVRALFIEGDEPASSTRIRHDLRSGVCPVPHLNRKVEALIRREGLYGTARV